MPSKQSRYGHAPFPYIETCPQYVLKVAQQTAFRAAFLVDQAIQEKQVIYLSSLVDTLSNIIDCLPLQSIIVRAQGEARSAELIGEAMRNNKGFLQLRKLEAARDIATLLSVSGNRVMLDSQSLLLNGKLLEPECFQKVKSG
jgi:hypothetical protein